MTPARMVCFFSVIDGDCVVLKDADGAIVKVKRLPIRYANFASKVNHRYWQLVHVGPGSFHFTRR